MSASGLPRRRTLSGGASAVLGLIAVASMGAENPDATAAKTEVRGAITAVMDGGTFKPLVRVGSRPRTALLSRTNVSAIHRRLASELDAHMTGKALMRWRNVLDLAIDRDSDGEHVLVTEGGVDDIAFESVKVDGDKAHAVGRAHTWVKWIIVQDIEGPRSGRPSGWEEFEADLVKQDGRWQVETLDLHPVPGGQT